MRLDIGKAAIEQLADTLLRQLLGDINELATTVIALVRVALGIFVGHNRALGFHHRLGDDVFRSDQLYRMLLAGQLVLDGLENFRVARGKVLIEETFMVHVMGCDIGVGCCV